MPKQYLNPPDLFPSQQYGFSQIVSASSGRTIYISGQVAWDAGRQIIGPGDFVTQTHQSFKNLETAVKAAGGTMADIVSLRIYIVQGYLDHASVVSQRLREFFAPDAAPASTWIVVQGLANPDFLIEIEAIAVIE
jgi:2-iminobutanoate/2-iminopropanoate deaminase